MTPTGRPEKNGSGAWPARSTRAFLGLLVFAVIFTLAVLVGPGSYDAHQGDALPPAGVVETTKPATPTPTPFAGPRTVRTTTVYVRPGTQQRALGLLPEGSRIRVLGRDSSGNWLRIAFPPGSTFEAWIPASAVAGIEDVRGLDIAR